MSKKKARRQPSQPQVRSQRTRRKTTIAISLVLAIGLAGGILAQWRATSNATRTHALLAPAPLPQPTLSPSSPSKEYIYAGGRLVATEEPGASSPAMINVALASNGAVATASSTTPEAEGSYPVSSINNGDHKGLNWGSGGGWRDGTDSAYPDWVQIDFNGSKSISEIDVFTVQDNYANPSEPTETQTFGVYGITDFEVQYWNGSTWATVTGGSIAGNNRVWKKLTFTELTTDKIRVVVSNALYGRSRLVEVEAYGLAAQAAPRVNVAAAANGATASASSIQGAGFAASAAINGDRQGLGWEQGGGWADATADAYPDWLQIDFNGNKTLTEIDVFTIQDNYASPAAPTQSMTFSLYGATDYQVQYWSGSAWADVPGGNITGNNRVWKQLTFSPVMTGKIRVLVNNALYHNSRIVEVEAYQ